MTAGLPLWERHRPRPQSAPSTQQKWEAPDARAREASASSPRGLGVLFPEGTAQDGGRPISSGLSHEASRSLCAELNRQVDDQRKPGPLLGLPPQWT